MHNLYEQFRQLIPDPPLQAGTVVGVSDLPNGAAGGFVYDSSGGLRAARP